MLVQLTTKNFRGHLSKQGKISKVLMLVFCRKKSTVTLEYSKLDESTSLRNICPISQNSEKSSIRKSSAFIC